MLSASRLSLGGLVGDILNSKITLDHKSTCNKVKIGAYLRRNDDGELVKIDNINSNTAAYSNLECDGEVRISQVLKEFEVIENPSLEDINKYF